MDSRGNITEFNPAAERLFGRSRTEVLGKSLAETLIPERLRDAHRQALSRFRADGPGPMHGRTVEMTALHADGTEVPVELAITSQHGADPPAFTGTIRDVSQRRAAESERQRLERQMLHAQKLESLGVLAGGIAHDFNNLLVSMLGNASLALEELEPDSAALYSVAQIERAAVRAAELTNQLLAYAGKGTLRRDSVDCAALVTEMAQLLETAVGRRGAIVYGCSPVPAIEADPGQVRQVVMNLITNAADALGDGGGTITVCTGTVDADAELLGASLAGEQAVSGAYVFIDVADTGHGMDDTTRARIFDPFFTTKVSGHGLGLAAVLGIVRNHSGAVHVKSTTGIGTSIRVLLPQAGAAATEAGVPATTAPGGWRGAGTVLVVDDEVEVREVAEAKLRRRGFDVMTATDGHEAVASLREHGSKIVCVLLDLEMPNLGGEAAFHAVREVAPTVPVVISTGYHEHASLLRIREDDRSGLLPKPYSAAQLASALRSALHIEA